MRAEFSGSDAQADSLWAFYRHAFPALSQSHITVYRLLWTGPCGAEQVIAASGLARSTVYVILRELVAADLVKKSERKPVKYWAEKPLEAYSRQCRKVASRLAAGKEMVKGALKGGCGAEHEIVVKLGAAGHKILHRRTRSEVQDEQRLREIRRVVDARLTEVADRKMRVWAMASGAVNNKISK